MVAEKETQVRDSMRMMGLNELAYWCSWLVNYAIINIFIASQHHYIVQHDIFAQFMGPGLAVLLFVRTGTFWLRDLDLGILSKHNLQFDIHASSLHGPVLCR